MPLQQFSLVVDRAPGRGRRVVVGGPARWDRSPDGAPRVSFDREAPSLVDAVTGAIADVEATGLRVVRVDDRDWVTLADVAARIGRSREIVRLWALGRKGPGGFPPPVNPGLVDRLATFTSPGTMGSGAPRAFAHAPAAFEQSLDEFPVVARRSFGEDSLIIRALRPLAGSRH